MRTQRAIVLIASCALELLAAQAVHAFLLRDPVESLWSDKAVQVDGRATEWPEKPALEEEGLGFRAMNDSATLYLLIRGETSDGRMVLSGRYRQDVTLWFVKPDGTSRAWGINLDFSHAHRPAETPAAAPPPVTAAAAGDTNEKIITLSAMGVVSELVIPVGLELSTATLPSGIALQANLSRQNGQQPLYEIGIPLKMIEHQSDSILMDFVTSSVSPDVMAQLQSGRSGQRSSDGGGDSTGGSGGGGGRHHRGGGSQGGGSPLIATPSPVDLHLEITLTQESTRAR